jgi:DNA polymerase-3 subunit delta
MPESIQSLDFLAKACPVPVPATVALVGSDHFLAQLSLEHLLTALSIDPQEMTRVDGAEAQWRDVGDLLDTPSLFSSGAERVVLVRDADSWLTRCRERLEKWIPSPQRDCHLIFEVTKLPGNTKLAKRVMESGWLIQCAAHGTGLFRTANERRAIEQFLAGHAKKRHSLTLTSTQIQCLLDRMGWELGMIDTELAKLALFSQADGKITDEIVRELVGGWRAKTVWEIADAVADGKIDEALQQIDRLIQAGQTAIGIMAPIAWYFRRFGLAAHLVAQGERIGQPVALAKALERAGFNRYDIKQAEARLIRIGRARAMEILSGLVLLDGQLKGSHSREEPARHALEQFLFRFAKIS